jgi:hypothetical protein
MLAYTKFDPRAFLKTDERKQAVANPANIAKVPERDSAYAVPLAGIAILAGDQADSEIRLDPHCAYCGGADDAGNPLLLTAIDGIMFLAHSACRDREWRLWQAGYEKKRRRCAI